MSLSNYSEEELALMSDDERAALEETADLDDDHPIVVRDDVNEEPNGEEAAGPAADEAGEAAESAPAAPAVDAPPANDGADVVEQARQALAADAAAQEEPEFIPPQIQPRLVPVPDVPADAEDQLKAITEQKADLASKLENFEVEPAEYHRQLDELNDKAVTLRLQMNNAQQAQIHNQAAHEDADRQTWQATCNAFVESKAALYHDNPLAMATLNNSVMTVANDPANAGLSGWQVLQKAHQITTAALTKQLELLARATGKQLTDTKPATPQPQPQAAKPRAALPPTLGALPAAGSMESGGEFDALDKMSAADLEAAIERMSDAQRERYLKTL